MDQAHIDVALTTSKHNVQYLLGGHRTFFFDHMEAMGPSRYLPVLAYPKGAPEQAAYVGHGTENFQHALNPLWTPQVYTGPAGSTESMQKAVDHLRKLGLKPLGCNSVDLDPFQDFGTDLEGMAWHAQRFTLDIHLHIEVLDALESQVQKVA